MKRFISILLIIVMISSLVFSGCSQKSIARDIEYVQDSIWFDNVYYNTKFYENCCISSGFQDSVISISEDELIVYEMFGIRENDEYQVVSSYALGEDGSCILQGSIDLLETNLCYFNKDTSEYKGIIGTYMVSDYVYAVITECYLDSDGTYQNDGYIQVLDVKNSSLVEEIRSPNIQALVERGLSSNLWFEGNGIYTLNNQSNELFNYEYCLTEMDLEFNVVNTAPIEGLDSSAYFSDFYVLDNNHALGFVGNNNNVVTIYDIDLDNLVATIIENPPEKLFTNRWGWKCVNGKLIMSDEYGIYQYDYNTNEVNEIFNYNNCNVIRSEARMFNIVYVNENSICACSLISNNGLNYRLWKFTKADSNPNVGKAILRIAALDERVNDRVAIDIYEFNENCETAFAVFDDRYVIDGYIEADSSKLDDWDYQQTDEYKTALRTAESNLSNQLRVDIISGDGPDIILDAYGYSEFNNSNCLIDLKSELISGGYINADEYLPCVFGHAEEIYQIPLSVSPRGLLWYSSPNDPISVSYGITYDEYLTLVEDICNGKDPISEQCDKTEYFLELFDNSFSLFIHDGTISIDNDEFRSLAEFVNNQSDVSAYDPNNFVLSEDGYYCGSDFAGSAIYPTQLREYVPSALPSIDGNASFSYKVMASIGVVSTCPLMDEALSLVCSIVESYSDSIRIDDVYINAQRIVADTIQAVNDYPEDYNVPEWAMLTGEEADIYLAVLTASTELVYEDSDVNIILYEEIQPYFAGDKTLDEVIPIIEDRCQTVLDERGL